MPKFSIKSLQRLQTCDNNLQILFHEVIKEFDCAIICGHRDEKEQNIAYENRNSKLRWPDSKHNTLPSKAVDVVPYPIDWNNLARFKDLAKIVYKKAEDLGIKIEWGGDWITFKDYPHYELED